MRGVTDCDASPKGRPREVRRPRPSLLPSGQNSLRRPILWSAYGIGFSIVIGNLPMKVVTSFLSTTSTDS
jgi:hypothetical protein